MKQTPPLASLDTNVLLLKLVAETDPALLLTFKRVSTFEVRDLTLLSTLLQPFRGLLTTPHVLTEISNFVDQAPQHRRRQLIASLKHFINANREIYRSSKELAGQSSFDSLGLADTGLIDLSLQTVIITTDYRLSGRITSGGGHCINFNHLRTQEFLGDAS